MTNGHCVANPPESEAVQPIVERCLPRGRHALNCGPGSFFVAERRVATKPLKRSRRSGLFVERIDADIWGGNASGNAVAFPFSIGRAGAICWEVEARAAQCHGEMVASLKAASGRHHDRNRVMRLSRSWKGTAKNPA